MNEYLLYLQIILSLYQVNIARLAASTEHKLHDRINYITHMVNTSLTLIKPFQKSCTCSESCQHLFEDCMSLESSWFYWLLVIVLFVDVHACLIAWDVWLDCQVEPAHCY